MLPTGMMDDVPRDPNMPLTAKERVAMARALANKIQEERAAAGEEATPAAAPLAQIKRITI